MTGFCWLCGWFRALDTATKRCGECGDSWAERHREREGGSHG